MNKGLKNTNYLIKEPIGNAGTVYINPCKENANFHLVIPITFENKSLISDLALIYSNSEKNVNNGFGKGIKLSFYQQIIMASDKSHITVINNDGTSDTYEKVIEQRYKQAEQNKKIEMDSRKYILTDSNLTRYIYTSSLKYPTKIKFGNGKEINYTYDGSGNRISKYVKESNGETRTISYEYVGNQLVSERDSNNNVREYFYDNNGLLYCVNYNGENYYYLRDNLSNIIGTITKTGGTVSVYKYVGYGSVVDVVDPINNPYRYKGYYLDTDAGLYYCESRWYNPSWGRFISPDSANYLDPSSINGLNLYSYCYNNPIMYVDPSGHFVITSSAVLLAAVIGFGIGAVSGAVYGGITAVANGQKVWAGIVTGFISGGIMGAGAGVASLFIAPILVGQTVIVGGVTYSATTALAVGTGIAFGSGAIGGAISDVGTQLANTGKVSDWGAVGISALQWGLINTAGVFLGSVGGPLTTLESALISAIFSNVTGGIGLAADVIRDRMEKKKQFSLLSYRYNYRFND